MIDRSDLESALRAELRAVDFDAGVPLTQAGLSSLDIVVILSLLHDRYGVTIPAAEMTSANFASVERIHRLAERYG